MRALREGVYRSLGLGFVMEEVYEGLWVVNLERRGFFLVWFVFFFQVTVGLDATKPLGKSCRLL